MKKFLITIAVILVVVLSLGLLAHFFLPDDMNPFKPNGEPEVAEVQYNETFGTDFKEKYPISMLTLKDNMPAAPYAFTDTTLFTNKRITKIDAPVATVNAVDENQYFTLTVIDKAAVELGAIYTDYDYREYKVFIPKEELTSTTVDKWISIDLTDQFIYVGENETLAFMKSDDPVVCRYASIPLNNFAFDMTKGVRTHNTQSIFYGIYTDDYYALESKSISILGDSISTFSGISNDKTNSNTTIGNNAVWYPKSEVDNSNETWWAQSAEATGMDVLVNNSWSGSRVLNNNGAAYDTRCTQLHGDVGEKNGVQPDIIAVYIGINDFNAGLEIGSFKELADVYTEEDGYIVPENVAQAYAIMIHKMTEKYDNSDIFLFTLPANGTRKDATLLEKYNNAIKDIAEYFDCYVVDLAGIEGYEYDTYTIDGLHPNELGMDLITDLFVRTLKGIYAPVENN